MRDGDSTGQDQNQTVVVRFAIEATQFIRRTSRVSLPRHFECCVTSWEPHKATMVITWNRLTFDAGVVVHRTICGVAAVGITRFEARALVGKEWVGPSISITASLIMTRVVAGFYLSYSYLKSPVSGSTRWTTTSPSKSTCPAELTQTHVWCKLSHVTFEDLNNKKPQKATVWTPGSDPKASGYDLAQTRT